ncbi:MAG: TetR/AcrR family transcriptional regulator [Polyangiaceae bacterium]|nr:TetR/AcrR family transcriptional regulator [Polyangiaceae bacterium]
MLRASRRRPTRKAPDAGRVPADQRRRQLLTEAGAILTAGGVEALSIAEVAARAGVSRPLVYRQFPARLDLVRAVLEDFVAVLSDNFHEALVRSLPGTIESITTAFIEASCDAIEARGAGPWRLLDARAAEPEVVQTGRAHLEGLLAPWRARLAALAGTTEQRAAIYMWVIVAAGRAALDGWIDGKVARARAVRDATVAVTALLTAFAAEAPKGR